MISFESGPDIETVYNASEFLGDTLNTCDNDGSLVYCTSMNKEGRFSMASLQS
jgi:hypothetical protein